MVGQKFELLLEFSVILLSPIVYHYYLWKYKKVELIVILKTMRIYLFLYGLIGATLFLL